MTNLPLDPARIRSLFPAFSEPSLAGQAFFENAGGSYTSQAVLDRLEHYYRATKVQPYAACFVSQAHSFAFGCGPSRVTKNAG